MDNANSDPINEEDFLSCFKYDVDSWGMMTANQTNYYDIWCNFRKNLFQEYRRLEQ
jgi:hypothetical protein